MVSLNWTRMNSFKVSFLLAILPFFWFQHGTSLFRYNLVQARKNNERSLLRSLVCSASDTQTREKISQLILENKVILFMKGNRFSPQWFGNIVNVTLFQFTYKITSLVGFPEPPLASWMLSTHRMRHLMSWKMKLFAMKLKFILRGRRSRNSMCVCDSNLYVM